VLTNDIFAFIRQVTLLLRRMPISQYGQANMHAMQYACRNVFISGSH